MVVLTSIAFLLAVFVGGWLVLRMPAGAYSHDKPQRFHEGEVSRLGGVALVVALVLAWLVGAGLDGWLLQLNLHLPLKTVLLATLALVPAMVVGLLEDLTQRVSVRRRMLATLMSGGLACWALDLSINRMGIGGLDAWLQAWPWLDRRLNGHDPTKQTNPSMRAPGLTDSGALAGHRLGRLGDHGATACLQHH